MFKIYLGSVKKMLFNVVDKKWGTAYKIKDTNLKMAGKQELLKLIIHQMKFNIYLVLLVIFQKNKILLYSCNSSQIKIKVLWINCCSSSI